VQLKQILINYSEINIQNTTKGDNMGKGSTPRRNRDDNAYRENHEAIFGSRDDKDKYKPYKPKLTKKGDDGLTIYDDEKGTGATEGE
jgi:hypothetical protein